MADYITGRVAKYSAQSLAYISSWKNLATPTDLAQAPGSQGKIYVTSFASRYIYEIDPSTGNLDPKDAGVMGYIGIDVSSSGDIFSTNTGVGTEGVTRWAAGFVGAPTTTRTNWGPFDVAVDGRNGNLLLTDYTNGRVVAFTQAGNLIKTLIDGFGPGGVTGLTIDAVGNIYLLAGSQNGRLLKYDSSGRLIARYGSTFSIPNGVAVGADGAVWVTEQSGSAHKITCMV